MNILVSWQAVKYQIVALERGQHLQPARLIVLRNLQASFLLLPEKLGERRANEAIIDSNDEDRGSRKVRLQQVPRKVAITWCSCSS